MARPAFGTYFIVNVESNGYLGIREDKKAIVSLQISERQVWEVRPSPNDPNIPTLINSKFPGGFLGFASEYDVNIGAFDAGVVVRLQDAVGVDWYFDLISQNTWIIRYQRIDMTDPAPIVCDVLNGSQTAQVRIFANAAKLGQTSAQRRHWLFVPTEDTLSFQSWQNIVYPFSVSSDRLRSITDEMVKVFQENLEQTTPKSMIPTYVTHIPNGQESGLYFGVSIAENEMALSRFILDGNKGTSRGSYEDLPLTSAQLGGQAIDLFDYIADPVVQLVENMGFTGPRYLGLTFSFPVEKTALNTGKLLHWTKEVSPHVSTGGVVGQDVVKLLQDAVDSKLQQKNSTLQLKCNALVNDTTAILLEQAYRHGGCEIGAIYDTGTNGAYVEKTSKVKSLRSAPLPAEMVLNTEWGSVTSKTLMLQRTQYDKRLTRQSVSPSEQLFEKLVSASFVGELTRLILLDFVDSADPEVSRPLFEGNSSRKLNTTNSITINLMWRIDDAQDTEIAAVLVQELDLPANYVSSEDGKTVKAVCRGVLRRAARLSACSIAAILFLTGRAALDGSVGLGGQIGIAGSLTRPAFIQDVNDALRELFGEITARKILIGKVDLKNVRNLGAALAAFQGPKI